MDNGRNHGCDSSGMDSCHAAFAGWKRPNANTVSSEGFPCEPNCVVFCVEYICELIASVKEQRRIIVSSYFKTVTTARCNRTVGTHNDRPHLGGGVFAFAGVDLAQIDKESNVYLHARFLASMITSLRIASSNLSMMNEMLGL
ncbi:hypothetical protein [Stenotrophomonas phage vB_SmaS_BUCT548]|uniref:Uncharacterized protein n=1 Tax=Stenotrophomonas phage vB_SmaS_BUCT548 TaxID=2712941 RepID=A0A7D2HGW7_9CAUD|nr:hypothetical protein PQD75_gp096 [Stenotrophomonas phage vB_SmaS_BUCT548]QIQ60776.1 hypothetical protein [Stenotrophomonas phage vB_SmaS_BUCT548]